MGSVRSELQAIHVSFFYSLVNHLLFFFSGVFESLFLSLIFFYHVFFSKVNTRHKYFCVFVHIPGVPFCFKVWNFVSGACATMFFIRTYCLKQCIYIIHLGLVATCPTLFVRTYIVKTKIYININKVYTITSMLYWHGVIFMRKKCCMPWYFEKVSSLPILLL